MNAERIDDLIARAVLGELTDAEAAELDTALADDPASRAEHDAELAVAAAVQQAVAEQPPAHVKASVLDAIAGVSQDGADDGATGHQAPTTESTVVSLDARRRRTRFSQGLLAAAAVITLVVGGVLVAGDRSGGPSSFDAVATAPDAELRSLAGTLPGSLRVIHSATEGAIVVDGANLPALSGDQTYQLWFVDTAGEARSAGLFRPNDDGRVMQRFDDLDPTGFVVGVTIEPAGGSDAPTLPIVASA